eukprot:6048913-Prymnesium_polylepis.1
MDRPGTHKPREIGYTDCETFTSHVSFTIPVTYWCWCWRWCRVPHAAALTGAHTVLADAALTGAPVRRGM